MVAVMSPRPYQREAIDAIKLALKSHNSTLCVLPTGCGKTVVACVLIDEWPRGGGNILFLAHTRELIEQAAAKIHDAVGQKPHIEMGIQRADPNSVLWSGDSRVFVGTVQSMSTDRRLDKYDRHPFDLVIVDEAHHAVTAEYRKVINRLRKVNPNLKVVGITATPFRADEAALGIVFESVAYQRFIDDMMSEGWLVPCRQLEVVINSLNFSVVPTTTDKDGNTEYVRAQLEAELRRKEVLLEMVTPVIDLGDRPTLIYTAGIQHSHDLAELLNAHGREIAAAVDGKDVNNRIKQIDRFKRGEITKLVNCQVLTEGVDIPFVDTIVIGRPIRSISTAIQIVGRGLRPLPGLVDGLKTAQERQEAIAKSAKPHCLVLNVCDVCNTSGLDVVDVLGGKYDVEVKELARKAAREGEIITIERLEQLKGLSILRKLVEKRQKPKFIVKAEYELHEKEQHKKAARSGRLPARGGSTVSQIGFLKQLGMEQEDAEALTFHEANIKISQLKDRRCTFGQAKMLGIQPWQVKYDEAKRLLDELGRGGKK